MATARMSKLKIVADSADKKTLLGLLTRSGCFEALQSDEVDLDNFKASGEDSIIKANQVWNLPEKNIVRKIGKISKEDLMIVKEVYEAYITKYNKCLVI